MDYKTQQMLDKLNKQAVKKGKLFYTSGKRMNKDGQIRIKGKPYSKKNG